ncbi:lysoplasmalogenase [Streptomyces brasiliensis]|uniref:Lysoplasmalogenase n=1 Tax=Streptomyces brasiliensis TaxID=1954 RepID=A0A917L2T2_9ACTN|nr:lysoplasmalogenase [Streptomyces brasiliensis]GGJ37877.1 hypothetical protein GCM10010121_056350 [Streptomyces brasiliensis]
MRASRALLTAFVLAAAVDLVALAVGPHAAHLAAKPLLMLLLAAYAGVSGAPRLLVAALLCGWGGDVLLMSGADLAFMAGMACFAAGHVCYLLLFRGYGSPRARTTLLAPLYALTALVIVVLLWPDLPAGLRVPVACYSTLLTVMAYGAATRLGPVAGLGGTLFLLSDTLLATGIADWPQLPHPGLWVMITYLAAQFLLVRGALGARRAPVTSYREVRSTTP